MKKVTFEELKRQLLNNEIAIERYVEQYNELLEEEVAKYQEPPQPHEHI